MTISASLCPIHLKDWSDRNSEASSKFLRCSQSVRNSWLASHISSGAAPAGRFGGRSNGSGGGGLDRGPVALVDVVPVQVHVIKAAVSV